jgi:hypothetical protein
MDLDFNSLYPSSFCGNFNNNNVYTGGRMFMPGYETNHIIIRETDDENEINKKRNDMLKIINSNDRFDEKRG